MSATLLVSLLLQSAAPAPRPPEPQAPAAEGAKVVAYPGSFFAQFRPDTALDMLNRLPGFTLSDTGSQRGFAGGEGNVRLDGQLPPSRGDNMTAILRRIPAAAVERIELVTGGAGGIDMQGHAVIANIIRKPSLGVQTAATAGATAYDGRGVAPTARIEMQNSDNGRLLEGVILYNEEPFGNIGPRLRIDATRVPTAVTPSLFDSRSYNENARISAAYETPFWDGRVRVNGTFGQTDTRSIIRDRPTTAAAPSLEDGRTIHQIAEAGGRYSHTLEGGTTLEASLFSFYRRIDSDSEFLAGATDQRFKSQNRSGEEIVRGVFRIPKRGRWTFDGGGELAYNWLDTQSDLFSAGAPVVLPNSHTEVAELRSEVFGAGVWALSPALNLQFGLRVEHSTITTEGSADLEKSLTYVKPRVIATWTPRPGHLVVLRLERTVDQLSFGDFSASASLTNQTIVSGNPDLVPAENLIAEARYEHRFAGRGAFVLGYTRYDIDNVLGRRLFTTPSGALIEATDNIGSGTREFVTLRLTAPLDSLGMKGGLLRLTHLWTTSTVTDPTTGADRTFSNEIPWEWSIGLSQEIPNSRWRWGVDGAKYGEQITFLPRETTVLVGGVLLSSYVEYRPAANLTVRLDALNMLDRESNSLRERYLTDRSTGVVNFTDLRHTRGLSGGRGYKLTVRRSF